MRQEFNLLVLMSSLLFCEVASFVAAPAHHLLTERTCIDNTLEAQKRLGLTFLEASAGKRKKRRRRITPPGATAPDPIKNAQEFVEGVDDDEEEEDVEEELSDMDKMLIEDIAKFEFSPPKDTANIEVAPGVSEQSPMLPLPNLEQKKTAPSDTVPLPDIRQAIQTKALEEEKARIEEEKETARVKIKRSDKEAFTRLLEQQPFADADDSFFVAEEYGTVSALLAEGAEPFLGLPSGPLQVGHFIGALGIMLMAFVEYPGFPLTNLPTPLRESLQGGLATIYAINSVLAVLAAFKASERGQSKFLWAAKTFSVGGIAFDQLTQLPTLKEIEATKAKKGARAPKNRKR